MSGQPYGEPYRTAFFDPELCSNRGPWSPRCSLRSRSTRRSLADAARNSHAHYDRGQHVVRTETLREVAAEIGLDVPRSSET